MIPIECVGEKFKMGKSGQLSSRVSMKGMRLLSQRQVRFSSCNKGLYEQNHLPMSRRHSLLGTYNSSRKCKRED